MRFLFIFLSLLFSLGVSASNITHMTAVPDKWKLENYTSGRVVVWYADSTCNNGIIQFGSNATKDDINRFWSLVMSAKIAKKSIFVRYEPQNNCIINSFGMHK